MAEEKYSYLLSQMYHHMLRECVAFANDKAIRLLLNYNN